MFAMQIDNAVDNLIFNTRDTGGDTQSARGDKIPDSGYMVGGIVDSLMFDAMLIRDTEHFATAYRMILRWVASHHKLATQEGVFLGGWIDYEENTMYVDLSRHYTDRRVAIHAAIENEELAIWDLAAGEEIRIS